MFRGATTNAVGEVDGIVIRVVTDHGERWAGYPTNLPRNP